MTEESTEEETMMPSEVRRRIKEQHKEIEAMLQSVEAMLDEPHEDTPGRIRKAVTVLADILQLHMAFEERHMVPAIREADGYGPVRVDALMSEHDRQRGELEVLVKLITEGDDTSLKWKIRALANWLRKDIEHEEEDYVTEDLLNDTLVTTDVGT